MLVSKKNKNFIFKIIKFSYIFFCFISLLIEAPSAFAEKTLAYVEKLSISSTVGSNGCPTLDFTLSDSPTDRNSFNLNNPNRFVIDLNNTSIPVGVRKSLSEIIQLQDSSCLIKNIRTGQREENTLRIVLDLKRNSPFNTSISQIHGKFHLLVKAVQQKKHAEANDQEKQRIQKIATENIVNINTAKTSSDITDTDNNLLQQKQSETNKVAKNLATKKLTNASVSNVTAPITIVPSITQKQNNVVEKNTAIILPPNVENIQKLKKNSSIPKLKPTEPSKTTVANQKKSTETKKDRSHKENTETFSLLDNKIDDKFHSKNKNVIIVIDPGHGGKDPGAKGKMGIKEKDVVLAIAKKVQKYINDRDGFTAILTRDGDYYVGLKGRLNIATFNKADLFISMHADIYKTSEASGTSIFALSRKEATSESAKWLAEKENVSELDGVSVKAKDPLHSVLVNIAQKVSTGTSLLIGEKLLSSVEKVAKIHSKTVDQAGFVVLQSMNIPALLIEIGFLSSPSDEKKLTDEEFQEKFANTLADSIVDYFRRNK